MPTFSDDQYFIQNAIELNIDLEELWDLTQQSDGPILERQAIETAHVKGQTDGVDQETFNALDEVYEAKLRPHWERETGLSDLQLQAVRLNTLRNGDRVARHADALVYIIGSFVLDTSFEGGDLFFEKDDGTTVDVAQHGGTVFVGKCTNQHGIREVSKGVRKSIVFFAMPKK